MKEEFLRQLKEFEKNLKTLRRQVREQKTERINKKEIRTNAESSAKQWFDKIIVPLTERYSVAKDKLDGHSNDFERLLKISAPNNLKSSYEETLDSICRGMRDDIVIHVQKHVVPTGTGSEFDEIFKDLPEPEKADYLKEATGCARSSYLRAAAVLGWCAAVDHVHRLVEKIGFSRFNVTSASMASQNKGRFRRFKKVQTVLSISELRQVYDTDVLWILEGMGLIDINEHTRLRSCFEMRCHAAHPGDAPITRYNLLSFFSDINEIIFKNPKFKLSS